MQASGCSRDIGAGWPGAIRRGLNVVYSSASDVKSFRVCFRYRIDLVELFHPKKQSSFDSQKSSVKHYLLNKLPVLEN